MFYRLLLFQIIFLPTLLQGQFKVSGDSISMMQDTITLQEVSVSGTQQTKVSGMLSGDIKLHVENLKSVPALTGTIDVLKLMELTPSVRTSGEGSSNMYVRGGDAGQNLILYNGITTYTSGHVLGIFPLFNADHLSWLKMSKGGADAEYGNFISSVIDINSKKDVPRTFSAKGNVGLLSSQATLAIPITNNWGVYASGRKTYLELLVKPILDKMFSSRDDEKTDIEYDFWDTNLSVIGKIGGNNTLSVDMMLSEDRLKIDDEEIVIDGTMKWSNALSAVNLSSYFSENLQLNQTISFSSFSNKLNTKQGEMFVKLHSKIDDISYKNKLSYSIAQLPFTSGVNYTFYNIRPHELNLINSDIITNSVVEDKIKSHSFSTFIATTWQPISKLIVKPILRYNLFASKTDSKEQLKDFHSLDARLSLQYQLNENTFTRANYSHNNQYVSKLTPSSVGLPTDFWIAATEDIQPQRGDEISLGFYKSLLNGELEVSADIYYRWMNNLTEFDYNFIENDNISFVQKIAYGTGRAYGLEVMLKKNMGKLTGWISYALGKSDRQFKGINGGSRFPARFDRTHDLSTTFNYKFNPRWDLSLTYIYATGNAYTQPTSWYFMNNLPVKEYTKHNNARMPNYSRADIGVNYWFKKDNGLNLSLYNTFAVENPIYVFMVVKQNPLSGDVDLNMKKKKMYTIIPSISWNFKF